MTASPSPGEVAVKESQMVSMKRCLQALLFSWSVLFVFGLQSGFAQPADPVEAAKPEVQTDWEKLIYLPYKNLDMVLKGQQQGSVVLPYDEYLKLWKLAQEHNIEPAAKPINAVITSADYQTTIDKNLAKVTATLTVQVLDKPWATVPLRFGNEVAIGKITSDGDEKALLRGTGNGTYELLLPTKGEHKITLELVTRVRTTPDGKTFALQVPSVGVTTMQVTIPEADQTVEIQPKLVTLPVEGAEGQTQVKVSLGSTEQVVVGWHPRASIKPDMELLTSVNNVTLVSIKDRLVHTDAFLTYEVRRGELKQVQIAVPADHEILDVSAPDAKVKGWQKTVDEATKTQLVTLELLGNVEKNILIEVHTARPLPSEPFSVAGIVGEDANKTQNGIHAVGVVRESGQLAISHGPELTLSVAEQQGLVRIEQNEMDERLRRPNAIGFKFYNPDFNLKLKAEPIQPQITVTQRVQHIFSDDELTVNSYLAYQVERVGVFSLKVKVPEGLEIDNVLGEGVKDFNQPENSDELTITLTSKQQGQLNFVVQGRQELTDEAMNGATSLPIITPLNTERETGLVQVFAPDSLEVITVEEQLQGLFPTPVSGDRIGNARLVSAWTYTRRPIQLAVQTTRKPTRLSASLGTHVQIGQEQVKVETIVDFFVEHAGVDTFRIAVPEVYADEVTIQTVPENAKPGIKQSSRADDAVDGWVTWTVVLQDRVLGHRQFRVTYDLEKPADEEADQPEEDEPQQYTIQPVQALGLDADQNNGAAVKISSVLGEVVISKDQALSVASASDDENLEGIDVRELRFLNVARLRTGPNSGSDSVSLAYRYFKQPTEVKVTTTQYEIQSVVETVVSKALVEVIIGRDPTATYRTRYRIRSSERQRLRVDLPKGMNSLGVLVNRKAAALEKNTTAQPEEGWESYWVNVARTGSADELFSLTLVFTAPLGDAPFQQRGGQVHFRMPKIGGEGDAAVAVQQLRTVVWVPKDYLLVRTPENFVRELAPQHQGVWWGSIIRDENTNDLDQWIRVPTSGVFDFPTTGHHAYRYGSLGGTSSISVEWWQVSLYLWVLSGAVLLIGLVLLKTSWENKLTLLLLAGFGTALYAQQEPEWVLHGVALAQWGLYAVVILWVIHGLFGKRRPTKAGTDPKTPPSPPGDSAPKPDPSNDPDGQPDGTPAADSPTTPEPPATPTPPMGTAPGWVVIPPPGAFDDEKK